MTSYHRIVIVEDQLLFMDGIKNIIELEDDLKVVGTASNGLEGLAMIKTLRPDLVLCDIRMPELNGIEMLKILKAEYSEIKVLLLTTFDEDEYLIQAINLGACGFMIKNISADDLVANVRRAIAGQWVMPQNLTQKLSGYLQTHEKFELTSQEKNVRLKERYLLTDREVDVSRLLAEGMDNENISKKLFIGLGTVKNHLTSIYTKMNVTHRTMAAVELKTLLS